MADLSYQATQDFNSPELFLAALRRSSAQWLNKGAWETPWIFRGQSCACWQLTPSSWRESFNTSIAFQEWMNGLKDRELAELQGRGPVPEDVEERQRRTRFVLAQMKHEDHAVQAFVNVAYRVGLRVPGPPFKPRRDLQQSHDFEERLLTYAMAQHHGMPTALLDFTDNPLYAAFFAVNDSRPCASCDRFCVWALDLTLIVEKRWREARFAPSEIDYLRAQSGLFLYAPNAFKHYLFNGHWPKLEDCVAEEGLRMLTLPKKHRLELLRLLWAEGVSLAHLMPTHDNVSVTLKRVWHDLEESGESG